MEKMQRCFVVPDNDLEARAIISYLTKNGEECLVTKQWWGASWENIEPEVQSEIEEMKNAGVEIIGIELQGNPEGVLNIDHHSYGEDDRTNPKSSLEQVAADWVGVELSLEEQFIAANDKAYIPGMQELGKSLGMSEADIQEVIDNVRRQDREIQGITPEQEAEAERAIEALGDLSGRSSGLIVVKLSHSKCATVTDRLFGQYENLLIESGDGETNFYGKADIINVLDGQFSGSWKGGALEEQGSGYWGNSAADQDEVREIVENIVTEQTKAKNGPNRADGPSLG